MQYPEEKHILHDILLFHDIITLPIYLQIALNLVKLYDLQPIFWAVEVSFCTFIQLHQSIKYQTQPFSLDLSISFILFGN